MTYMGIDRRRFAQLLEWGADDDELRRFFVETRLQLVQKGAKVQNPPHGKPARVRMLTQGMPEATDRVVQKWFGENLKMLDPKPVEKLLEDLRLYEEAGESPPEDEAKRLARSCLVHLFSSNQSADLMSFLRPVQAEAAVDSLEVKNASIPTVSVQSLDVLSEALGRAIVALVEGRDPDEFLSSLPPSTAAFVAGVHAVRSDRYEDARIAMEALDNQQAAQALLTEYIARRTSARSSGMAAGLQMLNFTRPHDAFSFNFDRDEVFAVCTRDFPETKVFLHPFAIRAADGSWLDLSGNAYREKLFYSSGDLIAFSGGRDIPRQPKRGEIGIWRVAENKGSNSAHRTNFHIASEKTLVYEVRDVPFESSNHDAVREYIKHAVGERGTVAMPLLFLLRDQLIIGCPPGKDLARDEGFDAGLPCWHTLSAFRFEGRAFVPGPLPPSELYECEALASSLRKLFAGEYWDTDKPTRALTRKLQDLIASGSPKLGSRRAARLRAELASIEEHEGAMSVLLEEVMRDPRIGAQVDQLVEAKVNVLVAQKERLQKSIQQLEQKQAELLELRRQAEKEQKAIAPAIAKAIRGAFDRARADAVGTLGEVAVFKTLIDELIERPAPSPVAEVISSRSSLTDHRCTASIVRPSIGRRGPIVETLRALGVMPKAARAIESVGVMARACGLMLIVDGLGGRIAAEAWVDEGEQPGTVLECGFGETDDYTVRAALAGTPTALAILDANLSPLDVYARTLVDSVLRRLAGLHDQSFPTRVVVSMADATVALPLPAVVDSISLRIHLGRTPEFIQHSGAEVWFDEVDDAKEPDEWFKGLWKPARSRVVSYLRTLPVEEAAIILAALRVAHSPSET
ncbi:hypothetical protein [Variovorax atrisoli]|uniref:hypothetical protein n=1 Tax=Variovorax atrisoli TaxID=3394203 RepID=UPI003394DAEA